MEKTQRKTGWAKTGEDESTNERVAVNRDHWTEELRRYENSGRIVDVVVQAGISFTSSETQTQTTLVIRRGTSSASESFDDSRQGNRTGSSGTRDDPRAAVEDAENHPASFREKVHGVDTQLVES